MGRSTRLAWGRHAITSLLPLIAVCALASPAHAGVRSQAASQQAIASALSQSTGLTPSQVTSQDVCGPTRPGFATCDAEALVLRSNHARVRPNVHGGASFTQVFPAGGRGIPSVRPAAAAGAQPEPGTPAWLQQAYDLTYLSQTRGAGDTVAIVDAGDDPTAESDLAVFRSTYGLPACTTANGCFQKVNQSGQSSPLPVPDPVWEPEESLDIDAVSALCPNCKILLVEANDASDYSLDQAVIEAAHLHANQISNSWSDNEPTAISGTYSFAGSAVIAATGDTGYVGGGYDAYPAAFPRVTAVGGTSLAPTSSGQSARGFGESAWSDDWGWGASSGCAVNQLKPAYQDDIGCTGRAYSDLSADGDPETGLMVYGSSIGGWWQYGGTSLATPLIAAYEAITGINGTTPQWAYTDSALLNDPAAGSSGDCPEAILYICEAGTGYDGPTGIGSISGAVVAGAPGIGGPSFGSGTNNTYTEDLGATTATLAGGVYPNGLDTTYYWQYGTTTAYGAQTAPVDMGAGQAPGFATAALAGLAPATTYHYRLVAQNADGTTYGYDSELTTASPPILTANPSIGGTARLGQTLSANPGGWVLAGGSFSYQWQRSPDGGTWTSITGAVGSGYTVADADGGDYLRVVVTATNGYGASTATSPALGPVPATSNSTAAPTGPRWTSRPRISSDPGRVGDTLTITPARWASRLRGKVTRVMRCTSSCVAVGSPNATRYKITPADVGSVLLVREIASGADGSTVVWSSRSIGPVASPSSAAVVLSGGRTALRNSRGATLAFAMISSISPSGDAASAGTRSRTVALRRALGVSGPVTAWICQAARTAAGAPPRCTRRVSLKSRTTVRLPEWMTGAVRVVVVRH
ncbi:MAG TPA: hypothetical protein VMB27_05920 [Solirubrobacteraceae bacterium]|nr:hypothetical protein [Solirubrobacteraceae bacterium]